MARAGARRSATSRACAGGAADARAAAGEEEELAERRQIMMNAEQFAEAIARGAGRARWPTGRFDARSMRRCASSNAAASRRAAGSTGLRRARPGARRVAEATAHRLDAAERSFAFDRRSARATPRSGCSRCARWPASTRSRSTTARHCLHRIEAELQAIEDGGRTLAELEQRLTEAQAAYRRRRARAERGAQRVPSSSITRWPHELPPLKLERARFATASRAIPSGRRRTASTASSSWWRPIPARR